MATINSKDEVWPCVDGSILPGGTVQMYVPYAGSGEFDLCLGSKRVFEGIIYLSLSGSAKS